MTENDVGDRIHRGLKNVYFERSCAAFINGRTGDLRYWGYSIHDLAYHSTFEETSYLLLRGELPTSSQLDSFVDDLKAGRKLPDQILGIIGTIKDEHPMSVLRTAVSALSAFDIDAQDNSPEAVLRKGIRLTSQVPMIVTAHHHIRNGKDPVASDNNLGHAANFLYMLTGERPSEDAARLIDIDMVLHAEHGSNPSSFAARVVTSTEASFHASVTAAIAALSGRAHGGATEDVINMVLEIGDAEKVAGYIKEKRRNKEPVAGFGHRIYRTEDPRARYMLDGLDRLSKEAAQPQLYNILQQLVEVMAPYARHGVCVNIDFYSGMIYYFLGIPRDLFTPIFAIGRMPGLTLQVLEQLDKNILISPLLKYEGPDLRSYVPIKER